MTNKFSVQFRSAEEFSRPWRHQARPHPDLLPQEKEQGANRFFMRNASERIPVFGISYYLIPGMTEQFSCRWREVYLSLTPAHSMNSNGQKGQADVVLTPHPQSFSPLRGEGGSDRMHQGIWPVQGFKARTFWLRGNLSPRRGGKYSTHVFETEGVGRVGKYSEANQKAAEDCRTPRRKRERIGIVGIRRRRRLWRDKRSPSHKDLR
jgi:hypothetical protein